MPEETTPTSQTENTNAPIKFEKPQVLMEWVGPARIHFDRDHNFFVALFVGTMVIGFILVLFRQYSLMLVIMALAFAIYATNKHAPKQVRYQVLNNSIKIDDNQYLYSEMASFWFEEIGGQKVLRFFLPAGHVERVEMVTEPGTEEDIENIILDYLPYEEVKANRIVRYIEHLVFPVHPSKNAVSDEN